MIIRPGAASSTSSSLKARLPSPPTLSLFPQIKQNKMTSSYYIGIDCGTASVRAALLSNTGEMLATHAEPIRIWNPKPDYYQQSSRDIWTRTCVGVKKVVEMSGVEPGLVGGIGFDATCSLVCLDSEGNGVSVSPLEGEEEQDIILWMDHRAAKEADEITRGNYKVLETVGMEMSPEMESPKMLWLKRNLPQQFQRVASFFDLSDFLVHKATGSLTRSRCPLVCKWTLDERGWDDGYWRSIGLGEFVDEGYRRIGVAKDVKPVGAAVGSGLSERGAKELGLMPGTAVASGMIDAHAGLVGVIGCQTSFSAQQQLDPAKLITSRLVMIAGTSTCHLINADKRVLVPGIWGPQAGSTLDGYWTLEGGQSATGNVLEHLVKNHAAYSEAESLASAKKRSIFELLNERIASLAVERKLAFPNLLVTHLHILSDFHGNRSPRPSPLPAGAIVGLSLEQDLDSLVVLYYAGLHALVYGTLEIVQRLAEHGVNVGEVVLTGGMAKNSLFAALHAEILGVPVILPDQAEHGSVRGAAIVGALAAGRSSAVFEFGGHGKLVEVEKSDELAGWHRRKFEVMMDLVKLTREARTKMVGY